MPFTRQQIVLHWAVVILVLLQFLTHEAMKHAWDVFEEGGTPAFDPLVGVHIASGSLILLLVIWRLVLRMRHGSPALPADTPWWMGLSAHVSHWGIYLLLALMPVAGLSAWLLGVEPAAEAHEVMWTILAILVLLHIAAALYHQFVRRDGLIRRMMRPGAS